MEAKKIVITGSATRIGAAIAKSLADYDVKITLHYNKSAKEVKKLKAELENFGSEVFLISWLLTKIGNNEVRYSSLFQQNVMLMLHLLLLPLL